MSSTTISSSDYKSLSNSLRMLGYSSYGEFLSSNLWNEFKSRVRLVRRPLGCEICKKECECLSLHHVSYKHLLAPSAVVFTCSNCHRDIHFEIEGRVAARTAIKRQKIGKRRKIRSARFMKQNPDLFLYQSMMAIWDTAKKKGVKVKDFISFYTEWKTKKGDKDCLRLMLMYPKVIDKVIKRIS